ncbi:uncharacterized protein F5147DRAFT_820543 [Suillus discolor]|uniref:Acyl-CoA dehydrogenase/oxidase C-terminal domain-containing protein n=1 Tax=Suillus discolor TaxID=1912936 RepID=A0A9P7JP81_9AGAM|nr:uncharacterized protein F5147DRAFT_820543 [Suillus discolor]KAG2094193.1 hypothetical protein F5147DRAFT_820543 [Suillus discolor]
MSLQATLKTVHESIDKKCSAKSLPPLCTFVINVISSESEKLDHEDMEMLKQTKLSSTSMACGVVDRAMQAYGAEGLSQDQELTSMLC